MAGQAKTGNLKRYGAEYRGLLKGEDMDEMAALLEAWRPLAGANVRLRQTPNGTEIHAQAGGSVDLAYRVRISGDGLLSIVQGYSALGVLASDGVSWKLRGVKTQADGVDLDSADHVGVSYSSTKRRVWLIFDADISKILVAADHDELIDDELITEDQQALLVAEVVEVDGVDTIKQYHLGNVEITPAGGGVSSHPWKVTLSLDAETGDYTASVVMGKIYDGLMSIAELGVVVNEVVNVLADEVIHIEYDYTTSGSETLKVKILDLASYETFDLDGAGDYDVLSRYPLAIVRDLAGDGVLSVEQIARDHLAKVVINANGESIDSFRTL